MKKITPTSGKIFAEKQDDNTIYTYSELYAPDDYEPDSLQEFESVKQAEEYFGYNVKGENLEDLYLEHIKGIYGEDLDELMLETVITETELIKRKDALTPIPTSGEEWNHLLRYIKDETSFKNVKEYIALKQNKGKDPEQYPELWKVKPSVEVYPEWSSVPDGTQLTKNSIYSHSGQNWKVQKQHFKATMFEPREGSSNWTLVL